ncbi:MAG TPA: hypothetical protein VGE07_07060 [Herpetosiphonaceae bacterium]
MSPHAALRRTLRPLSLIGFIALVLGLLPLGAAPARANGGSGTISDTARAVTWTSTFSPIVTPDPSACTAANCDTYALTVAIPANYWDTHEGGVTVEVSWAGSGNDYDLYIQKDGQEIASSASGGTTAESVDLGKAAPGVYQIQIVAYLTTGAAVTGRVTLTATEVPAGMIFPETDAEILRELTVDYPLNVIFVGYQPTAAEVEELRAWIPDRYRPTVATKSPPGDETQNTGASLLNWNKNHLITSVPYFEPIRYNYKLRILVADEGYARALFQVAENNTAPGQAFHGNTFGPNLQAYNTQKGALRVAYKTQLGDPNPAAYAVADATKTDLIDAYAVEDWIFNSRFDAALGCSFKVAYSAYAEPAGTCYSPSILNPDPAAYHDPFYDKNGLNIDRMPQGASAGSSLFFFDTFTPAYAGDYFRPNAYHTWGTDKVIGGAIDPRPAEDGGSWRITDPDNKGWDGIDWARTWGGRYRMHFIDLGAAPNTYESAAWLSTRVAQSSDYPFGDPPIWQYKADPQWGQAGDVCQGATTDYTGGTPCRMMPRLGRDVAYSLFFRMTPGYLYRPIPRGDTYWLAVTSWTEFYSRPQNVNGIMIGAPAYGDWWTNTDKLYKINDVTDPTYDPRRDDVLRWLSSATPYARWVGRKNQVIPLYDPTTNLPTGRRLDTSPKYEDLPAPEFHAQASVGGGAIFVPEPLYDETRPVTVTYAGSVVNLSEISNVVEKTKAKGLTGAANDFSVPYEPLRDYIDEHRPGIADVVPGVNTIPAINMVFEDIYTWALPVIVGGIAAGTEDGEAWGVFNNVNDRVKWDQSHYPPCQLGQTTKCSTNTPALPTQSGGSGFSYTIEHEAAHNLGLSHPHDGAYGVDRCPDDDPDPARRGQWECYWTGLGWLLDSSAAPTTYAMSYRPYEVEDQDALQRGHAAEYLLSAQESLRQRLLDEAAAGRTTPSPAFEAAFAAMKQWRAQAGALFRVGDWLHAEYAARNAAIAARGIPQTGANTIDPRLVEAGQVFYFNIRPQRSYADQIVPCMVAVAKRGPNQARPGDLIDYSFRVEVQGATTMNSVAVSDALPPGLSFVSVSAGGVISGNTVTWQLGDIPDAQGRDLALRARVSPGAALGSQIVNVAEGSAAKLGRSPSTVVVTRIVAVIRNVLYLPSVRANR